MPILKNREDVYPRCCSLAVDLSYLGWLKESWLLDDDVLAISGNDVQCMLVVHPGRRNHGDRIYLRVFDQHLMIVVVSPGTELLVVGRRFFRNQVTHCNQLGPFGLDNGPAVMSRHSTTPDDCDVHGI